MSEELITLYSSGSLPGIAGDHAPGTYLVDYEARTIRPAAESTSTDEAPTEPTEPTPLQDETMPDVVAVPDLPQDTSAQESTQG